MNNDLKIYVAFWGYKKLSEGALDEVLKKVSHLISSDSFHTLTVFDMQTGALVPQEMISGNLNKLGLDFKNENLRRSSERTPKNSNDSQKAKLGRPKLGVVAREVTLLPAHWEWLSKQKGGASALLRQLVDKAMQEDTPEQRLKEIQASVYRFLTVIAVDLPDYQKALQAVNDLDGDGFLEVIEKWPEDVCEQLKSLLCRK